MKVSKRTGIATGGGVVWEKMVLYGSKNRQMARCYAEQIIMPMTEEIARTKAVFRELASASRELTPSQRAGWAGVFPYSAHLREVHDSSRLPHFMRKHVVVPTSWRHAFIFSNYCAAYSNLKYPRFKPPDGTPPVPRIEAVLDAENNVINGKLTISGVSAKLKELVLRLWLGMQYIVTVRGTIHTLFNIEGPIDRAVIPFSIDYVRCAGRTFGIDRITLADILFGDIYLWADCVATHGPEYGAKVSSYSQLVPITMPIKAQKYARGEDKDGVMRYDYKVKPEYSVSDLSLKVLNRVVKYRRAIQEKHKTKVIQTANWRITDTAADTLTVENPNAKNASSSIKIYDKYGNEMK